MAAAHAQDFERRRRPGAVDANGKDDETDAAVERSSDEEDDEDEDEEVERDMDNEQDMLDADEILRRHRSAKTGP